MHLQSALKNTSLRRLTNTLNDHPNSYTEKPNSIHMPGKDKAEYIYMYIKLLFI